MAETVNNIETFDIVLDTPSADIDVIVDDVVQIGGYSISRIEPVQTSSESLGVNIFNIYRSDDLLIGQLRITNGAKGADGEKARKETKATVVSKGLKAYRATREIREIRETRATMVSLVLTHGMEQYSL